MAERREAPTRKHLLRARAAGVVPRSHLFGAVSSILAMSVVLWVAWAGAAESVEGLSRSLFAGAGEATSASDALAALTLGGSALMGILGPVLVVVLLLCAVGAFLQVGPGFNPETLYPKMARLSWRSRRPDPSRAAADGGLRVLLMMALVGIGASAVVAILSAAARRPWRGLQEGLEASSGFFADLSFQTLTVLAVFAIGDLLLQRHRHRQDVRMSRAQKQRDQRESQSGPITRRRRRGQRRAEKWSLGIEKLPLCLVVVSDGKDHAAALQYRPGQDPTPRVLSAARGVGAGSILAGARSLGLPVHQDGPLAAALTLVEPGLAVPESLYAAVAAVVLEVSGENSMPANP